MARSPSWSPAEAVRSANIRIRTTTFFSSGEARVEYENETVVIPAGTTCRVTGRRPHAVWNNTNQQTVMLGLTI